MGGAVSSTLSRLWDWPARVLIALGVHSRVARIISHTAQAGGSIAVCLLVLWYFKQYRASRHPPKTFKPWNYGTLRTLLADESLPCMVVDIDAVERNADRFAVVARAFEQRHGKTVRLATKSIRVPYLIFHLLAKYPDVLHGLMCFSVKEAHLLSSYARSSLGKRFDNIRQSLDFLIAYPTVQPSDLQVAWDMTAAGHKVHLQIDSIEHVEALDKFWAERHAQRAAEQRRAAAQPASDDSSGGGDGGGAGESKGRDEEEEAEQDASRAMQCCVCIDVDMSLRPLGFHVGAHRSPIRSLAAFKDVFAAVQGSRHLRLTGVMGYEAQVAGLMDRNPFARALNPIAVLVKRLSMRSVIARRRQVVEYLQSQQHKLEFFNGGGSGNFAEACSDSSLTEVAAGSGVLQASIFDWYADNENEPACAFALQCTRSCSPGRVVCCQSGGFIASGEIAPERAPQVFVPRGLTPFGAEGFGEVQTPLQVARGSEADEVKLRPGDPVFFRPPKSGEIAERFNEYLITRGLSYVILRATTYRGLGYAFY